MITDRDIARWRLRSQRLVRPRAAGVTDVVANLLAVQAENPRQSEWALATRTGRPAERAVQDALATGRVIRTHVLRPTWHYALAEDVGWLLDLTAPRVRPVVARQLADAHGLDERRLSELGSCVVRLLEPGPCTRAQLAERLTAAGVDLSGHALMLLLALLELDQLLCSGGPLDGEHTYDLFERRLPNPRRMEREEALAELALRYFTGHGPATERDLAYWATLSLTDVRLGLEHARGRLDSFEHAGSTFWHAGGRAPRAVSGPQAQLLQILDELYRGYQDSRWMLDGEGIVPRSRVTAIGMAVVDGQLVSAMRRTVSGNRVTFKLQPYRPLRSAELEALQQQADAYGEYLRRTAELVIVGEAADRATARYW